MTFTPQVAEQSPGTTGAGGIPGNNVIGKSTIEPADYQGIVLESMTGPQCQIDEIDDFSQATVGLLKDAVCHCLNLADWVQRHHIQLYFNGIALVDDEGILEEYEIQGGSKISYIIMIA